MGQCSLKGHEGLSSRVTEPAGCTRPLSVRRQWGDAGFPGKEAEVRVNFMAAACRVAQRLCTVGAGGRLSLA